jgi:hypothetical protein
MEFLSPSTHKPERVHSTSVCLAEYVPPSGFLTLSTGCSSLGRPALFQTGCVLGVSLCRGFPPLPGPTTRRREIALLTFPSLAIVTCYNNNRARDAVCYCLSTAATDRLPPSGPCSSSESVPLGDCYILPNDRSPLELSLSSLGPCHTRQLRYAQRLRSCAFSVCLRPLRKTSPRNV